MWVLPRDCTKPRLLGESRCSVRFFWTSLGLHLTYVVSVFNHLVFNNTEIEIDSSFMTGQYRKYESSTSLDLAQEATEFVSDSLSRGSKHSFQRCDNHERWFRIWDVISWNTFKRKKRTAWEDLTWIACDLGSLHYTYRTNLWLFILYFVNIHISPTEHCGSRLAIHPWH